MAAAAGKLDDYVIQKRLAPALFGDVLLCAHKPSGGALVAVKRVQMAAAKAQRTLASGKAVREDVALERALGRRFRAAGGHAHVLVLREEIEFDGYLYLVSDFCARGELYEIVSSGEADGALPVETTRKYVRQIATGVRFVHAMGFAHRDLSLENVLVDADDSCKVCDFGLACATDKQAHETVGKMFYMAPEVVAVPADGYDATKADVWSLGVMLFIMLVGAPPVERASAADARFRLIASEGVRALIDRWDLTDSLPADALDLLARMIRVDADARATMDEVLAHPFLKELAPEEDEAEEAADAVESELAEHETETETETTDATSCTMDSTTSSVTYQTMQHYLSHYKARCKRDYRGEGDSAARKLDLAAEKDLQRRLLLSGRRNRGSFSTLAFSRAHFQMSRTRIFFAKLGRLLFRRGGQRQLTDEHHGEREHRGSTITIDTREGRVELGRLGAAA